MKYLFSDFSLDTKQHKLHRAGKLVETEPKVFAVLVYLLQHRGQLISREALLKHCWSGMQVSDGALSRCISRVRHAVGHAPKCKLIETVNRKGYRFVGEISELADDEPPEDGTIAVAKAQVATKVRGAESKTDQEKSYPASMADARQRNVTVLSCRRAAANRNQPSNPKEALLQLCEQCQECVAPLGGHLMRFQEECLVFYFGYLQVQEDSARRAMLAGLAIMERVPLKLDIAIHSETITVGPVNWGNRGKQPIDQQDQGTAVQWRFRRAPAAS